MAQVIFINIDSGNKWLVSCSVPSHHLNNAACQFDPWEQCQWNLNKKKKKNALKMSSAKCWPFCSGLNVLTKMNFVSFQHRVPPWWKRWCRVEGSRWGRAHALLQLWDLWGKTGYIDITLEAKLKQHLEFNSGNLTTDFKLPSLKPFKQCCPRQTSSWEIREI